jgi:hypothetical protein
MDRDASPRCEGAVLDRRELNSSCCNVNSICYDLKSNKRRLNMMRKLVALSALALLAAPAFAETGVGTMQIDNVSTVYGRASVPTVKIVGKVVTKTTDVNVAGRESIHEGATTATVVSAHDTIEDLGRS